MAKAQFKGWGWGIKWTHLLKLPSPNQPAKRSDSEHINLFFFLASDPNIYTSFTALGHTCIHLNFKPKVLLLIHVSIPRHWCLIWWEVDGAPRHPEALEESRLWALLSLQPFRQIKESANAQSLLEKSKALFVQIQSSTRRDLCYSSLLGQCAWRSQRILK